MRGAQPDAECPRCGNLQPPSGQLATCLKCGLVFPPHEIQRRAIQRRDRATADKLVGPPPPAPTSLLVRELGAVTVYGWTDRATSGLVVGLMAVVMAVIVWTARGVAIGDRLGASLAIVIMMTLAVGWMRRPPQLWLDAATVRGSFGVIAFGDVARADSDVRGRLVVELRDGRNLVVGTARDVRITDHLARVIEDRAAVVTTAQLVGPPHTGGGGTS